MAERASDPYQVLLKTNKLPMSLIRDGSGKNGLKEHQAKIAVESSPFANTFGPKAQRKRVKLNVANLQDLAGETAKMHDTYLERQEQAKLLSGQSGQEEQPGKLEKTLGNPRVLLRQGSQYSLKAKANGSGTSSTKSSTRQTWWFMS